MTRAEKVWKPINERWSVYGQGTEAKTEAEARVKRAFISLNQIKTLPINAIEVIGHPCPPKGRQMKQRGGKHER